MMRPMYLATVALCALLVAACGSSKLKADAAKPSAQQTTQQVDALISGCMPKSAGAEDPILLKGKGARTKFEDCLGIQKGGTRRLKLGGCVLKVALSPAILSPTTAKAKLKACVESVL